MDVKLELSTRVVSLLGRGSRWRPGRAGAKERAIDFGVAVKRGTGTSVAAPGKNKGWTEACLLPPGDGGNHPEVLSFELEADLGKEGILVLARQEGAQKNRKLSISTRIARWDLLRENTRLGGEYGPHLQTCDLGQAERLLWHPLVRPGEKGSWWKRRDRGVLEARDLVLEVYLWLKVVGGEWKAQEDGGSYYEAELRGVWETAVTANFLGDDPVVPAGTGGQVIRMPGTRPARLTFVPRGPLAATGFSVGFSLGPMPAGGGSCLRLTLGAETATEAMDRRRDRARKALNSRGRQYASEPRIFFTSVPMEDKEASKQQQ